MLARIIIRRIIIRQNGTLVLFGPSLSQEPRFQHSHPARTFPEARDECPLSLRSNRAVPDDYGQLLIRQSSWRGIHSDFRSTHLDVDRGVRRFHSSKPYPTTIFLPRPCGLNSCLLCPCGQSDGLPEPCSHRFCKRCKLPPIRCSRSQADLSCPSKSDNGKSRHAANSL